MLEARIEANIIRVQKVTANEKQLFKCKMCDRTNYRLSNMKDHVRTHLATKIHRCFRCGRGFVWKGNRHRHY